MALINCPSCGAPVSDAAPKCPKCGHQLNSSASSGNISQQPAYQQVVNTPNTPVENVNPDDKPNFFYSFFSFVVPLFGWIYYYAARDNTPIKAKSCFTWAWIGFGLGAFIQIIALIAE